MISLMIRHHGVVDDRARQAQHDGQQVAHEFDGAAGPGRQPANQKRKDDSQQRDQVTQNVACASQQGSGFEECESESLDL